MRAYNFGARRSNLTKLFHVTYRESSITIWAQFWGDHALKIWEGTKRQKLLFRTTWEFDVGYLRNATSGNRRYQLQSTTIPPTLTEKIGWTVLQIHDRSKIFSCKSITTCRSTTS